MLCCRRSLLRESLRLPSGLLHRARFLELEVLLPLGLGILIHSLDAMFLRLCDGCPLLEGCIGRSCSTAGRLKALVNNRITGLVWKSSECVSLPQALCLRNVDGEALTRGVDLGGRPHRPLRD